MANTSIQAQNGSVGGLPVPLVKLNSNTTQFGIHPVKIEHSNGTDSFFVYRYPTVTAVDLTQEQIEKGVYVEMAHYTRGKSPSRNIDKTESGYVVPAPQIGGANPLGNKWTRGGQHMDPADRPNHYRVTAQNELIPVFEYLKNRHVTMSIGYYDTTGNIQYVSLPVRRARNHANIYPGTAFMYSGRYQPYYFKFRYVMWDDEANNFVSGPWSRVVKLATKVHPFQVDAQASALLNRQVGVLSPMLNTTEVQCWIETRLP